MIFEREKEKPWLKFVSEGRPCLTFLSICHSVKQLTRIKIVKKGFHLISDTYTFA